MFFPLLGRFALRLHNNGGENCETEQQCNSFHFLFPIFVVGATVMLSPDPVEDK